MLIASDFKFSYNPEFFQDSWLSRARIEPALERLCLSLASSRVTDGMLRTVRQQLLAIDTDLVGLVWDIDRGIPQEYDAVVDKVAEIAFAYHADPELIGGAMELIRSS